MLTRLKYWWYKRQVPAVWHAQLVSEVSRELAGRVINDQCRVINEICEMFRKTEYVHGYIMVGLHPLTRPDDSFIWDRWDYQSRYVEWATVRILVAHKQWAQ